MKASRSTKKILTILFGVISSVTLLGVLVFVILMQFGGLEALVNRQLREVVSADTKLRVQLGDIQGDFLRGIVIRDVVIDYDDGTRFYRLAHIPRVSAGYVLDNLWFGRWNFSLITIDSADITVRQDSSGAWLLPKLRGSGAGGRGLTIGVGSLAIHNTRFSFESADSVRAFRDIELVAGVDIRDRTYGIDIRQLSFSSHLYGEESPHLSVKLTLVDSLLAINSLRLAMSQVSLDADLVCRFGKEPSYSATVRNAVVDMAYLSRILKNDLRGRLTVSGEAEYAQGQVRALCDISGLYQDRSFERLHARISGSAKNFTIDTLNGLILGGCEVAGKGSLDMREALPQYTFDGSIGHFDIAHLANGAVASDLNGSLRLTGSGLRNADMRLEISANLSAGKFERYPFHSAVGDFVVTTDSASVAPGFVATYFENEFRGGGSVVYKGDINIAGEAYLPTLNRFTNTIFIREPAGRAHGTFHLSGPLRDPNIAGTITSDSLWLYELFTERASCEFDVSQFLTRRLGYARGTLGGGTAWDFAYDSAAFVVSLDSTVALLDKITAHTGEAHMAAQGSMDYAELPYAFAFSRFGLEFRGQYFRERDTVWALYDTLGVTFTRLVLSGDGGEVAVTGRANFNETLDLSFRAEKMEIRPWIALAPNAIALSGALSCVGTLKGSFDSPRCQITGGVDSLRYRDFVFGELSASLDYADSALRIDTLSLDMHPGVVSATGVTPLLFRLRRDGVVSFPSQQSLTVAGEVSRWGFLSYFLPDVDSMAGKCTGQFVLRGTPAHPRFDGSAQFRDGSLWVYQLENKMDSLTIDLALNGSIATVSSGSCRFNPGARKRKFFETEVTPGHATVSGTMEILSVDSIRYNLDITGKKIPINYTLGAFVGTADGRVQVTGESPPRVTGDIDLSSGLYEEEFVAEDAGYLLLSQFERPEAWDIDVNVRVLSGCMVRNSEIEATFTGTANARRLRGLWQYVYDIQVERGKLYVPTHFRLDQGGTVVNQDYALNDPTLNLIARTRVRVPDIDPASLAGGKTREVTAAILVTGTLAKPIVSAYDDPSVAESDKIAEEQLYTILALGADPKGSGGKAGLADQLKERAALFLSAPLARLGARSIGVETFDIDPNADVTRSQVTLGFYLAPGLYTYGRSNLGVTGQEVGFEALLTRGVTLQGRRDEYDQYSLFLRFGWDY